MNLANYLDREGISQKEFAERTGLSPGTISLLVRGLVGVSNVTLDKLIKATRGKVNENDFEPVLWQAIE
jgi:transcriptional regulator with XRE-family HTH domain